MSRATLNPPPPADGAPVVAVAACRKRVESQVFHAVGDKYLRALADAAQVVPLIVPALGARHLPQLLTRMDGLFLTGSTSNVEPRRYGDSPSATGTVHDPGRDATTFGLIETALAAGAPILAVCRGLQELNVVLGGTLHQQLHARPGSMDHREPAGAAQELKYAPSHAVNLTAGGMLERMAGVRRVTVNSLHDQGIDVLAPGAVVEATSDDGLVEAFRLDPPHPFVLAVQWHPEWRVLDNPLSLSMFREFGQACRQYAANTDHDIHRAMV